MTADRDTLRDDLARAVNPNAFINGATWSMHDAERTADALLPVVTAYAERVAEARVAEARERFDDAARYSAEDEQRAERAEAALTQVRRVIDGRHPMPYDRRDGDALIALLKRIRVALPTPTHTEEHTRG